MTQNLKAPKVGAGYIRNGKYHWYTRATVTEAHILQKHLNRLGFNSGAVDGIIGPLTKGAILRMQKFLGTAQDGYVGPLTRALLNNSCPSSDSSGDDSAAKSFNKVSLNKSIFNQAYTENFTADSVNDILASVENAYVLVDLGNEKVLKNTKKIKEKNNLLACYISIGTVED